MTSNSKAGGARKGAGRKKYEPSEDEKRIAINACRNGATVEELAIILGISDTVCAREFDRELKKGRASRNVFVKGCLLQGIKKGNPRLIEFYMRTQCGWKDTDPSMNITVDKPEQIVFNVQAKPSAAKND